MNEISRARLISKGKALTFLPYLQWATPGIK